jgi:hypothetical protein
VDRLSLSSCADGGKDSSDARDAERYRFIQNSQWYVGPEPEGDTQGVSWCNFNCDQQPLDTHIDAAIAKEKK